MRWELNLESQGNFQHVDPLQHTKTILSDCLETSSLFCFVSTYEMYYISNFTRVPFTHSCGQTIALRKVSEINLVIPEDIAILGNIDSYFLSS